MAFGEARLAIWYRYHERRFKHRAQQRPKPHGNSAFGGEKSPAGIVAIRLWPLRPGRLLRRASKRFFYHHMGQY